MIRLYRPEDLPRLREITEQCFDGVAIDKNIEKRFGSLAGHDWKWRKLRHIDDDTSGTNANSVFVWDEDGQVRGYVTGRLDRESGIGRIPNLAVDEAAQGKGIGRKLLQHMLEHFREEGMECAKIETLEQNPIGPDFYPSLGFQEVGRQIHYAMRLAE